MHIEKIIAEVEKQSNDMYAWMNNINVCVSVLNENNTIQTTNNKKILKRIARIEDKLKIVNIEEGD